MAENQDKNQIIPVNANDLPLCCPQPGAPLWARHPRVYLDILKTRESVCPYCGAKYQFQGEVPKNHH